MRAENLGVAGIAAKSGVAVFGLAGYIELGRIGTGAALTILLPIGQPSSSGLQGVASLLLLNPVAPLNRLHKQTLHGSMPGDIWLKASRPEASQSRQLRVTASKQRMTFNTAIR